MVLTSGVSARRANKEQAKLIERFVYRDSAQYKDLVGEISETKPKELDFEKACKKLEQTHIANLTEGRRLKKSPGQINVLLDYFEKKPTWNYAEKVAIAVELDMTFS